MEKEEIETLGLEENKVELLKKLSEIAETMDTARLKLSEIGVEGNDIWSSPAAKNLQENFLNDYQKFLQLHQSFSTMIDFLNQVGSQYQQFQDQVLAELGKIESVKL